MEPVKTAAPNDRPRLLGMGREALASLLSSFGEPAFRASQLFDWLYKKGVEDFGSMANLPAALRERLSSCAAVGREKPAAVAESGDGTKKYLFPAGGGRFVESAYIPDEDRATLCVSTQVGCKMACRFCATGKQGFQGQLDAGAIVNQLLSLPERKSVTNIVYMGMGEPLDNPEGTFGSLELLTSPSGIGMSSKRITVSTIGLPDPLREYLERFDSHLAVSLHSPFDDERLALMPVQRVSPVKEILSLLKSYRFDDHRRLSFEYIMFDGLNDDAAHAKELVRILNGLNCRVNLIPYHDVSGNEFRGSPRTAMEAFQAVLKGKGVTTTIRRSRGEDIHAACGLLSTKAANPA